MRFPHGSLQLQPVSGEPTAAGFAATRAASLLHHSLASAHTNPFGTQYRRTTAALHCAIPTLSRSNSMSRQVSRGSRHSSRAHASMHAQLPAATARSRNLSPNAAHALLRRVAAACMLGVRHWCSAAGSRLTAALRGRQQQQKRCAKGTLHAARVAMLTRMIVMHCPCADVERAEKGRA